MKEPQCKTATFHAVDTQPLIGTATSKIKKVVISGYIFAYVFEDVLGLSSPLKACHLITPLSSACSPVGTCQSPARQLIMPDRFPLSSWCRAWVFVNTWINFFNPKTNCCWKKQAEKAFQGVFSNSLVHGFFGSHRASCTNGLWMRSRLWLTGLPKSLALQGKKGTGNTADAQRSCQHCIGGNWKERYVVESAVFFLQLS